MTERFNWGETSRPEKVYYELHQFGMPEIIKGIVSTWKEGFYCGSMIRGSNIENRCTHIYAAEEIHIKLWNATGESPEDVYTDFTVWFYTHREEFSKEVRDILFKKDELLSQILKVLKRGLPPHR